MASLCLTRTRWNGSIASMRLAKAPLILGVAIIVICSTLIAILWADMPVAAWVAVLLGYLAGGFALVAAYVKREKPATADPPLPQMPVILQPAPTTPSIIPIIPEPYFAHRYFMPGNFTGRKAERDELTEWFTKGNEPMFVYEAIGGMGKSAVTWYWLHEDVLKANLATDGIIWWSFYEKESRFETFLEKALIYVTHDEQKVRAVPSTYERMELLRQLLCKKHYLIIFDGAERILRGYAGLGTPYQGDEVPADKKDDYRTCVDPQFGTFLQWLISPDIKSKILITSRLLPKELDGLGANRHKFLEKLDKVDAVAFFQQQGIAATRVEIEAACDVCGYHPLSLRLLSGMIRKDPQHASDIHARTKYNSLPKEVDQILKLAYNSLDLSKRNLISKLSAFRRPMDYGAMSIFQGDFCDQKQFDAAVIDLVDRGMLLRDLQSNKHDFHPIIRSYCYDRLIDKQAIHSQLHNYFVRPRDYRVESIADLDFLLEAYHHTVNSGNFDEALQIMRGSHLIPDDLWYRFGAYGLCIELLLQLFPDGEDMPPRLKDEADQAWTLGALANSYYMYGQPRKSIPLHERDSESRERRGDEIGPTIVLVNLAACQLAIGSIDSAESNLRRSISLSLSRGMKTGIQGDFGPLEKIMTETLQLGARAELGLLLAYRARFDESIAELAEALKVVENQGQTSSECVIWSFRAQRALLISDPLEALGSALKVRELADEKRYERSRIRAEWLLGAAHLACSHLDEAENHLNEALSRDRRINMVDHEASILLEVAKLRHAQKHDPEALKLAIEALTIADRCEYRLQQAEIHNFLGQFYFDTNAKTKARKHAEIAKERAECGYVPALKQAETLLAKL
jgi:tetratricopeptide (TPR) repeat protein